MHEKATKINEITTEKMSKLSKIWRDVYSPRENMSHITKLFEDKAKKEGFTLKEIDLFLSI